MVDLEDKIAQLETAVSALETKMDDLFLRPRMPYTFDASSGDVLTLDMDKIPQWEPYI